MSDSKKRKADVNLDDLTDEARAEVARLLEEFPDPSLHPITFVYFSGPDDETGTLQFVEMCKVVPRQGERIKTKLGTKFVNAIFHEFKDVKFRGRVGRIQTIVCALTDESPDDV